MQLHPSFLCSISLNILCKLKHTIKSIPPLELKDNYVKERNHLFPSLFFLRFYKVCCTQQVVNNYCLRSHSPQIPKHAKHDSSWNFFFSLPFLSQRYTVDILAIFLVDQKDFNLFFAFVLSTFSSIHSMLKNCFSLC